MMHVCLTGVIIQPTNKVHIAFYPDRRDFEMLMKHLLGVFSGVAYRIANLTIVLTYRNDSLDTEYHSSGSGSLFYV